LSAEHCNDLNGKLVPDLSTENYLSICVVTRFAVDQYPVLERISKRLQWWRAKYEKYHLKEVELWTGLWNSLKKQVQAGIHTKCFVEKFMEVDYPRMGISEAQGA
jgi:hypothetical protein